MLQRLRPANVRHSIPSNGAHLGFCDARCKRSLCCRPVSVCQSVCPSSSNVVSTLLQISSNFLFHFLFLFRYPHAYIFFLFMCPNGAHKCTKIFSRKMFPPPATPPKQAGGTHFAPICAPAPYTKKRNFGGPRSPFIHSFIHSYVKE